MRLPARWYPLTDCELARLSTPWGPAQTAERAEPPLGERLNGELLAVSTAGHGGAILTGWAARRLAAQFPMFAPWANGRELTLAELCDPRRLARDRPAVYLEEDCDFALVPLAFPEWYDRKSYLYAVAALVEDRERRGIPYYRGCETYLSAVPASTKAEALAMVEAERADRRARLDAEHAAEEAAG